MCISLRSHPLRTEASARDSHDREALQELVHFLVRHLLAELRKHVAQLAGANLAAAFLVKDLETLDELVCATGGQREASGGWRAYEPSVPAGRQPSGRFRI